jgi:hypothetical protein
MRLTDEELRDVLARAEEIQLAGRHGDAWNAERSALISTAEEVGLSREPRAFFRFAWHVSIPIPFAILTAAFENSP